jgi:hypothetical protein
MTRKEKLQAQGQKLKKILKKLNPKHHLLIHGTLGQGKSSIIKEIAKKTGVPVIEMGLDGKIKKRYTRKEVRECLRKLKKRMKGHDFLAEILDDAFNEHIYPLASEYLTYKEHQILNPNSNHGYYGEDLSAGMQIVIDEFVSWLSPKRK